MAIQPNPDFIPEYMEENFGTKVLITNVQSDYYLEECKKRRKEALKEKEDDDLALECAKFLID